MRKKWLFSITLTIALIFSITQFLNVMAIDWDSAISNNDFSDIEKSVIPFDEIEIDEYNQAPELDSLVEEGELPEIEERLPEEPQVVVPSNKIGEYGGEFSVAGPRPHFATVHHAVFETVLDLNRYDPTNMEDIHANVVKDWEMSEDDTELTLYLREGMKWSDGEPFTAEDFRFYYEDIVFNEELTDVIPPALKPLEEVEVVDDYTFRYHFDRSYSQFDIGSLYSFNGQQFDAYAPAHFMKDYHIDYNEDATELAEEEGFDEWTEIFEHYSEQGAQTPKEVPTLGPWVKTEDLGHAVVFERNPYYWKVDPAGNQLPYFDEIIVTPWEEQETFVTMIVSGDVDFAGWSVPLEDYPTIKKNEDSGNYDAWFGKDLLGNKSALALNHAVDDDGLREVFNTKEFKQALSLAIDREEINELVYLGQGEPQQATFHESNPGVDEEWTKAFIEYDPEKAKQMLDDIGVVDENGDGWREQLDGEELTFKINVTEDYPYHINTAELLVDYFRDIGIDAEMEKVSRSLWNERSLSGDFDAAMWMSDAVGPNKVPISRGGRFTFQSSSLAGVEWEDWLLTDGEEGKEPPQEVKKVFELGDKLPFSESEEKEELISEIGRINAENLWWIGTVNNVGSTIVASRDLGNVRREDGSWTGDDVSMAGVGGVNWFHQFYFKAEDRR